MNAVEALAQHTSHTLNAYGLVSPPLDDDGHTIHIGDARYEWTNDDLCLTVFDDPHLLRVTFDPKDFELCNGLVRDVTTGRQTAVDRPDRVSALCRYMLGFLDI